MPRQINTEAFIGLEGQVVERVPEEQRANYKYWRAVHLGAVALNFLQGKRHLNSAWGADHLHFWDNYSQALATAESLATPGSL